MVGSCQNRSKRYQRLQLFFPCFFFFSSWYKYYFEQQFDIEHWKKDIPGYPLILIHYRVLGNWNQVLNVVYWVLKGLYVLTSWARPWIDPAAATIETTKQAQLNIFSQVQVKENFGNFDCAMYISMGKYTVNGQKDAAPSRPTKSLKNGNIMAITAVTITYTVLHTSLKELM